MNIDKYVESLNWLYEEFYDMDSLSNSLDIILGIRAWDDSVCVEFGNRKLVISVDGPYKKRLVMKSALIHASTDVVVKGAVPLFAMDTLIGNEDDIREMVKSLREQSMALGIPILGGNTLFEDAEPRCNITVVGKLIIDEPIRDSTPERDDIILVLGEPIWGEREERIEKAKKLFDAWFEIIDRGIEINAAKDITKGGLVATLYEISKKSNMKFDIEDEIPFSMTRNLDNFLIFISPEKYEDILEICKKNDLSLYEIGRVLG
ncbi:MAG: hypothetical protein DRO94_01200 [Candidatus Altiarchaeales archaeon]|nr:MAG: hypothetical protein DRO94_01200 [Candidatus Altiarchaeales archaeon]HDO82421.1 hypothetical protein [Candidatus Altiarchaeales archaeon]HEX55070.1 hypothetical protein [Candidatus Altiarchaeales archaeon]